MKRLSLTLLATLALCCVLAPSAPAAAFDLEGLDVSFEEEDGTPTLLSGSHPFQMTTSLGVSTETFTEGTEELKVPEGEIKDLAITQITGFVGSQTAVPTCSQADFNNRSEGRPACPDETAVGYTAAEVEFEAIPAVAEDQFFYLPVYNLEPPPGVAAQLGFIALNVPVTIDVTVNPAFPHNLVATLKNVPQAILLYRSEVVLWGNPAAEVHDPLRGSCLGKGSEAETSPEPVSLGNCPVDLPDAAFLTLPRSCKGPLDTSFAALSWKQEIATGTATTHAEAGPEGFGGCEDLGFEATVSSATTTTAGATPTGFDFGLHPDTEGLVDPAKRAQADVSSVEVTLPEGMVVNPSSANGLKACSLAQYQAEGPVWDPNAGCPEASKLGTVEVKTPLIDQTLEGDLFVASQDDNPFGTLFALYMVIRNERYGVLVKQAGKVEPNPVTGRLYSRFDDVPELPFSDFEVSFRSGPRSPLATPPTCGPKTSTAILHPSSGGVAISRNSVFNVTQGPGGNPCPVGSLPFSPSLAGGTLNSAAGSFSPFAMRLTRADGQQPITRLDSVLPPGVVGKIAGLGRCGDLQIAAATAKSGRAELSTPSCPADSRIGTVRAGAGYGSLLTYVDGALYLAGPYAGAPLSVVAITPAVTGPFDLGTVVIREALDLNPTTAEVEVKGIGPQGQIPAILKGVPLALRDLRVEIDRPNFTLNATSCEAASLRATLFGTQATANLAERYQASGCGALGFKPKLTLSLKGATKRGKFPAVKSTLTPRAGDANIGRAVVFLPPSQQIENSHINNPCTRVQFAAEQCPPKSILGTAKAISPLLDAPLEGNVYFRSNGGERELPDIVADLRGQFRIILVGFIDTKGKRIRTTFASVPDAPVSKFTLNLFGGKRGLLVNNRDICKQKQRAKLSLTGHNGAKQVTNPVIGTSCKGKPGKGKGGKGR
jgi:hypothetical protein